eukprot:297630-Lingulodinium_polyedra.AAC.1
MVRPSPPSAAAAVRASHVCAAHARARRLARASLLFTRRCNGGRPIRPRYGARFWKPCAMVRSSRPSAATA